MGGGGLEESRETPKEILISKVFRKFFCFWGGVFWRGQGGWIFGGVVRGRVLGMRIDTYVFHPCVLRSMCFLHKKLRVFSSDTINNASIQTPISPWPVNPRHEYPAANRDPCGVASRPRTCRPRSSAPCGLPPSPP